jgi:hypothetical protein
MSESYVSEQIRKHRDTADPPADIETRLKKLREWIYDPRFSALRRASWRISHNIMRDHLRARHMGRAIGASR